MPFLSSWSNLSPRYKRAEYTYISSPLLNLSIKSGSPLAKPAAFQFCYLIGFLSYNSNSSFPISSAYIFIYIRCWTLLEILYLFNLYALQYYKTFRNSYSYLDVWILTILRFCPIIIYNIAIIDGNITYLCATTLCSKGFTTSLRFSYELLYISIQIRLYLHLNNVLRAYRFRSCIERTPIKG